MARYTIQQATEALRSALEDAREYGWQGEDDPTPIRGYAGGLRAAARELARSVNASCDLDEEGNVNGDDCWDTVYVYIDVEDGKAWIADVCLPCYCQRSYPGCAPL